ncbi:MAG: oligosaccharide flippase family protein, partial [Flavobacteriales bacterium]|nr:oligosaccharide flippase family protein [Flavobacteriales bacterium]
MGIVKKLGSQTAYYGLSSVVGRLLNYLLVPLYTYVIIDPAQMGVVTYLYALAALFNVFLSYGMETAFFRYMNDGESGVEKVRNTAFTSIFITTSIFALLGIIFYQDIARWIEYEHRAICILYFVIIVAADAYAIIPFARLRQEGKAKLYAVIRIVGILVGILLNVLFIYLLPKCGIIEVDVDNIFLSNVISSVVVLVLLLWYVRGFRLQIDVRLWK